MEEGATGQFITVREHAEFKASVQREQSEIREEVGRIRARLEHLPDDIRELRKTVQDLKDTINNKQSGPGLTANTIDAAALAVHRLMDRLQTPAQVRSGGGLSRAFDWVAAIVIGGLGMKVFLGLS